MIHSELNNFKRVINLGYVVFYINEFGDIILAKYKESAEVTLDMAKEILKVIIQLKRHKITYGITDATSKYVKMRDEAKKYFGKHLTTDVLKLHAIVVNDLAIRIGADFYIHFEKPKTKTIVFNNFKAALKKIELSKKEI